MKERFKELSDKNPNLSSAMVFVKLIWGKGYSKPVIRKWFNLLVDKEDYERIEKESLLKWLYGVGSK